jgi:hypothetical protein
LQFESVSVDRTDRSSGAPTGETYGNDRHIR